jgi:phosphoglycolate phosphatase
MKDVAMAQKAGVHDVHAAYGVAHKREEYELLREVTHWTAEDVERERRLSQAHVQPTFVLEEGFADILRHFDFGGNNA